MSKTVVAFGVCGSFCTFEKTLVQMERLRAMGYEIIPIMSFNAAGLDTRFGKAEDWIRRLEETAEHPVLRTLDQVEPLGPRKMADIMVVAPCTGTTLAKLDLGISDTPVTLGVKSMLRGGRPILLAPSTNDGLGASARHLAELLNRKHYFLVPLGQDAPYPKPNSLQSCFEMIPDGVEAALRGNQLQPVLLT